MPATRKPSEWLRDKRSVLRRDALLREALELSIIVGGDGKSKRVGQTRIVLYRGTMVSRIVVPRQYILDEFIPCACEHFSRPASDRFAAMNSSEACEPDTERGRIGDVMRVLAFQELDSHVQRRISERRRHSTM